MPALAIMGKHWAEQEPDGYGWFSGDLADDMPTQLIPQVQESLPTQWAEPTPEVLAHLLEALENL
ncbi:hypothetical protein [Amycolatopsis rubida]|uniref:Uncharacterized protein n=1 Tax=Amycolatopsis rubida TaxID=112413 RepID=A0A1I5XC98_9PSEU|nr:hypothetical protein [Amycolatopsis rubida]SFQ29476.1 hypothetical protein SAMN05421854_110147 [Amycolatopsis rubida]